MSMFKAMSNAVVSVFTTTTNVFTTADEVIGMGSNIVHNHAVAHKLVHRQEVMAGAAERLTTIQQKIKSDSDFEEVFEQVEAYFNENA